MAQTDTQAAGSGQNDWKEIEALEHRARTCLLAAADIGYPERFEFWRGYISALRNLVGGVGLKAAAKDAALSGYQASGFYQAAWTALPDGAERLSIAQVKQVLAAHGVQTTADPVADRHINAVEDLKHSVVAAVDLDDKQASTGIDSNNGSLHGHSSCNLEATTVAQEGGAV